MVVIIKNKEVRPLEVIWRTALKCIFAPRSLKIGERREMEEDIIKWANHLELRRELAGGMLQPGTIDHMQQTALELIGNELKKDMDGKLEKRKALFIRHGIDYRKFYRLPEAYKEEDFVKGQQALEKHKLTNPEDYQ